MRIHPFLPYYRSVPLTLLLTYVRCLEFTSILYSTQHCFRYHNQSVFPACGTEVWSLELTLIADPPCISIIRITSISIFDTSVWNMVHNIIYTTCYTVNKSIKNVFRLAKSSEKRLNSISKQYLAQRLFF